MLDNNKWLAAFAFLMMTLGARYIHAEFTALCNEKYLDNVIMRKLVLFCIFYVVTREVKVSIVGVLIYVLATNLLKWNVQDGEQNI